MRMKDLETGISYLYDDMTAPTAQAVGFLGR